MGRGRRRRLFGRTVRRHPRPGARRHPAAEDHRRKRGVVRRSPDRGADRRGGPAVADRPRCKLREAAATLKSSPDEVPARVAALVEDRRRLERELADAKKALAMGGGVAKSDAAGPEQVGGHKFLGQVVEGLDPKELTRRPSTRMKQRVGSGIAALVAVNEGRASVAVGVTDDLTGQISAVDLVKAAVDDARRAGWRRSSRHGARRRTGRLQGRGGARRRQGRAGEGRCLRSDESFAAALAVNRTVTETKLFPRVAARGNLCLPSSCRYSFFRMLPSRLRRWPTGSPLHRPLQHRRRRFQYGSVRRRACCGRVRCAWPKTKTPATPRTCRKHL